MALDEKLTPTSSAGERDSLISVVRAAHAVGRSFASVCILLGLRAGSSNAYYAGIVWDALSPPRPAATLPVRRKRKKGR